MDNASESSYGDYWSPSEMIIPDLSDLLVFRAEEDDLSYDDSQGSIMSGHAVMRERETMTETEQYLESATPYMRFLDCVEQEKKLLQEAIANNKSRVSGPAIEEKAKVSVKEDWVEQGIWRVEWERAGMPGSGDKWRHEEEPSKIYDKIMPQQRELSAPLNTFPAIQRRGKRLAQFGQLPSQRVLDKIRDAQALADEEHNASRPINQFLHEVSKTKKRIKADRSYEMDEHSDFLINTSAYDVVRVRWEELKLWNAIWCTLPGEKWNHEYSIQELREGLEAYKSLIGESVISQYYDSGPSKRSRDAIDDGEERPSKRARHDGVDRGGDARATIPSNTTQTTGTSSVNGCSAMLPPRADGSSRFKQWMIQKGLTLADITTPDPYSSRDSTARPPAGQTSRRELKRRHLSSELDAKPLHEGAEQVHSAPSPDNGRSKEAEVMAPRNALPSASTGKGFAPQEAPSKSEEFSVAPASSLTTSLDIPDAQPPSTARPSPDKIVMAPSSSLEEPSSQLSKAGGGDEPVASTTTRRRSGRLAAMAPKFDASLLDVGGRASQAAPANMKRKT
ncbi:hypothetical protein B0I35DRAFT_482891 [Stachybotrys elegans]|uniref:Uncharacterized protein n=1 Tax=Stachybotrys elegans TaxID=80388 RepID=A0A8K0SGH2_9HYPO|nr:hypothetical protein B0I35DRAFT_482891 [Stachybotrys elegans]